jgi:hypothetical protein
MNLIDCSRSVQNGVVFEGYRRAWVRITGEWAGVSVAELRSS